MLTDFQTLALDKFVTFVWWYDLILFSCSPPAQLETVDLNNTFSSSEEMVRLKQYKYDTNLNLWLKVRSEMSQMLL